MRADQGALAMCLYPEAARNEVVENCSYHACALVISALSQAVMPSFMGTTNSCPMQAERRMTRPPAGADQAPDG